VAIEFGLHGPYLVLIGGAAATIDAIEHAAARLARGACARAIVLAVETVAECGEILRRGGAVGDGPLAEAAVAALLEPAPAAGAGARASAASSAGESLACGPLLELAARRHEGTIALRGRWRGREASTTVAVVPQGPVRPGRKES
jgi:hypothetical protein